MSLLSQGSPAIVRRLGTPTAKKALTLQGVKLEELVLVADVLELQGRRAQTPLAGERKRRLGSLEHARQLLAQVLWEEGLCRGIAVEDEPPPYVDTEPPGPGWRSPRPGPTAYPLSRPQSAYCARMEKWERSLDHRHRQLEDSLQCVASAREQRSRRLGHVSEVWRERLQQSEQQIAAFQQEQEVSLAHYGRELASARRRHHREQASRFEAEAASYTRALHAQGEERAERAQQGRVSGLQERELHVAELCLESYVRRGAAAERRGVQRGAKTARQVQQQTSRQLQHWQKQRLDELRRTEQAGLREVLDSPTIFSHRYRYD